MTTVDGLAASDARATPPVTGDRARREGLIPRVIELIDAGTTDMADDILRVPLSYYRSRELFEAERDAVMTTPIALTSTSQLSEVHDFVVRDALGTSVLMTRGDDGRVRAFLNYCRHRGAQPAQGCGSSRRFTCPYHAWTYDTGGQLVGLPGKAGFDGMDTSDHGLVELPCEERHGFVWVVLTAGAPLNLDDHLGPLDAELAQWGLDRHHFFEERSFGASVNWKAALEAFAENYHFAYVHSQSIIGMNTLTNTALFDSFGPHHRLCFPSPWTESARDGVEPPVLESLSLIYWVWPNLVLAVTAVGAEVIDIMPGGDVTQCDVRHGLLLQEAVTDDNRAGYGELFEAVHAGVRVEDFTMLPSCGEAIRHGQHEHMVIGRNEIGVQNVVRAFSDLHGLDLLG